MSEYLVQMLPMLLLGGLISGWLAEALSRAGGYGLIPDMVLGLAGSVIMGAAMWLVVSRDAGMLTMLLVGCAGAAVPIVAQRGLWPSARLGT